jgi:DNA primase
VPPRTPLALAFDPDTAGRAATERAYELLRDWPGPLDGIALPDWADPANWSPPGGVVPRVLVQGRQPLTELLIFQRIDRYRIDEIPGRLAALHAVAPLLAEVAARDVSRVAQVATAVTA